VWGGEGEGVCVCVVKLGLSRCMVGLCLYRLYALDFLVPFDTFNRLNESFYMFIKCADWMEPTDYLYLSYLAAITIKFNL